MKKINKYLYWTPRVLSILFLLFLAMFSLDVFDGNYGFWGTLLALFMHNIPVFILATILYFSWSREWIAGSVFIAAGFLYCAMILINVLQNPFEWYMLTYPFIIAGPAFFIGILFLLNWRKRKKKK